MPIAMAERIDAGLVRRAMNERVVRRNASVISQTYDLAGVVVWILRARAVGQAAGSANRHVEHAVAAECEARGFSVARGRFENVPSVDEPMAVPPAARQRDGAVFRVERLVIREVDPMVLCEARMQRDVHQ